MWPLSEIPKYVDLQNADCLSAAPGGKKIKTERQKVA